ncbi:hypothetical protein CVT24_001525 [Panaeolus cyanescens]|uniref:Uncharacterized protein n=1 Tax=Panaeolus cyanescens TaxID=181874 RepID=A0A409YFA4_9AGAR|nr:hypothetical protein CVT24_001525 [Panaeolus cyanescens]
MTTVRAGRLVKSRRSPSKKGKGRVQYIQPSNHCVHELNVSSSFRHGNFQGSPPRVAPRARESRINPTPNATTVIASERTPSIPSNTLSRQLVLLWKCITNVHSNKKSRRFSYIPDDFVKVVIQPEPQTPRANRRHAGFWNPPTLPPSPASSESGRE